MMERMVQLGLVERSEDTTDRRVKHIALSAHGRTLIQTSLAARRAWLDEAAEQLSPENRAAILTSLQTLLEAVERVEGKEK